VKLLSVISEIERKRIRDGIKFYVDKDDYERFVKGYKFMMNNYGYVLYSSTKDGLNNKKLHRVIMDCPDDMFDRPYKS
jgi:hypothetical protein